MRADPFGSPERVPDVAAQRHFTNREEAIRAFQRAVATPADQPLRVLVYYGVGGVGKTALLHRLQGELERRADARPTLPAATVDLEGVGDKTRAYREVLLKLRSDLGAGFGLDFPRFDLCLAVLLAREGDEPPPLIRLNPRLAGTFKLVFELFQLVPGVGVGVAVLGKATQWAAGFPAFQEFLRRAGGMEEVMELRRRAAQDDPALSAELVRRFAQDLSEGLPQVPDRACRGVLFLDTYEHLWTGRDAATAQARQADWWVRDLVKFCLHPRVGVLPVIAARDRLPWDEGDPAWAEVVEQHLLGGLSAGDAQTFLARCGIGKPMGEPASALQEAIIGCADTLQGPEVGCHPLFLALCAEIVLNTRKATGADPSLATFAGIPSPDLAAELAARFLTSLHSSAMELWVTELSLTPRFDEDAALDLAEGRRHAVGRADWQRLIHFSFLEPQPGGFYRLHATMRAALRARVDPDAARPVHERLQRHWEERGQPSLAWYHRWTLRPDAALLDWWRQHQAALEQFRIAEARALLSWWSDVALDGADRQVMDDELWAMTHRGLGLALLWTPFAPRRDALDAAIAHFQSSLLVYVQADFPEAWAAAQNGLGRAYASLPTGDLGENLRRAIACYEAALRVHTEADFPQQWAMVQNSLGQAFADLPTGDRGENLRRAIACHRAALRVYTEANSPEGWVLAHNSLGNAYRALPDGDRAENLRQAIASFESALRVSTEATHRKEWAMVQNNLGNAYVERPDGDREENLRRALACYEAALRVYVEDDFPDEWAGLQSNLGVLYSYLRTGDRAQNLQRAIAGFESALRVYSETDFPRDWAAMQNNLGEAYRDLPTGDRAENLERAIACHEAALRVHAESTMPAQWAETQHQLAISLLALGELTGTLDALRRAHDHGTGALRGYVSVGLGEEAAEVARTVADIDAAIAALTAGR